MPCQHIKLDDLLRPGQWSPQRLTSHWQCFAAGMIGCGTAATFQHLLAWRWVTGIGSALQMAGAQLFLADISQSSNRARSLGINQVNAACQAGKLLLPQAAAVLVMALRVPVVRQLPAMALSNLLGVLCPFCLSDASLLSLGSPTLYILQAHAVQAASLVGSLLGPTIGGFLAEMAGLRRVVCMCCSGM